MLRRVSGVKTHATPGSYLRRVVTVAVGENQALSDQNKSKDCALLRLFIEIIVFRYGTRLNNMRRAPFSRNPPIPSVMCAGANYWSRAQEALACSSPVDVERRPLPQPCEFPGAIIQTLAASHDSHRTSGARGHGSRPLLSATLP